ncbi:MAG: glycosyltransferase [Cyclobacteriaceae bacterium]
MSLSPTLSIVVCTYNRAVYIGKTLEHLIQQTIDNTDYEVVIVNNKSTDQTAEICQGFIRRNPEAPIQYVLETNQGHSYSRNRGIQESKGEIVAFIDDDAFVHPDFGANIISYFRKHPAVQAIGGKILPVYEGKSPAWMSHFLLPLVSALDMGNQARPFTGRKFPVGANIAFRKSVFDRYGLFNVALGRIGNGLMGGDEKELIYRLKTNNEPVFYVPDVVVDHIIPEKRLQIPYIRGLAKGVGQSEKRRLSQASAFQKTQRFFEEGIKISGTCLLVVWYYLKGRFAKGNMLIRFRIWVLQGFFSKYTSSEF